MTDSLERMIEDGVKNSEKKRSSMLQFDFSLHTGNKASVSPTPSEWLDQESRDFYARCKKYSDKVRDVKGASALKSDVKFNNIVKMVAAEIQNVDERSAPTVFKISMTKLDDWRRSQKTKVYSKGSSQINALYHKNFK
jgi:hypothetical protein